MLQIAVLQNHQQGRDTHLRQVVQMLSHLKLVLLGSAVGTEEFSSSQVKVHSPVESCVVSAAEFSNYTTVGLKQFQSIRYYWRSGVFDYALCHKSSFNPCCNVPGFFFMKTS